MCGLLIPKLLDIKNYKQYFEVDDVICGVLNIQHIDAQKIKGEPK